jgi:hypothetical protein
MFVEWSSIITIIHHSLCSSIPFALAYVGRKKARVLTIVAATPARAASPPSKKPAKSSQQHGSQSSLVSADTDLSISTHIFPLTITHLDLQHGDSRRWIPVPRPRPPLPRLLCCRHTRKSKNPSRVCSLGLWLKSRFSQARRPLH